MATQLDQATRDAVMAEANARAQRFGISPEQALYNYARENNISNADVDTYMGYAPGSADEWVRQRDAAITAGQQPAPQGYSYASPSTPGPSTPPARQPLYAGLSNNSNAADIAAAYREWADTSGGDTTENQRTAEGYLSNLGIGSGAIRDAYTAYKGQQPAPQQPQNLGLGGYNPQQNPYLGQMGRDIGSQMFDNWSRTQMPSIRSGAMAAGGFGGSRQGVVEANALNDMNRQYGQALTGMYGQDWANQQGRNLQQQGISNSYDLGLRSNALQDRSINNSYDLGLRSSDLGFANLDANIAQNNFGNQMQAANFGLGAYNTLNNQTQAGIQAGTNIQNTPLDYQKYFTGSANTAGGQGGTSSGSTTTQGNPYLGAIGGAQIGNAFQYPKP